MISHGGYGDMENESIMRAKDGSHRAHGVTENDFAAVRGGGEIIMTSWN